MIKELIERFKNHLFHLDAYKKSNEEIEKEKYFKSEILPNYKFGDIIWALRYDFDWDKEDIGKKHEIGPYIVLDKNDDKLICMYCTSVPGKKGYFAIGEDGYMFNNLKQTYTTTFGLRAIDYESFVGENEVGAKSLNSKDKELIAKKYSNVNIVQYNDLGKQKALKLDLDVEPNLTPGDIIKEKNSNLYKLVLKRENGLIYTISIKYYDRYDNIINFCRENIVFSIKEEKQENNIYVNTISNAQFSLIEEKYKEHLKLVKEKQEIKENLTLKRGALLSKHRNYYYVFNTEKDKAKLFSLTKVYVQDENTIKIGTLIFKPNYEDESEINIKDGSYHIIRLANEKEMDNISSSRKKYYKTKKEEALNYKEKLKKQEKQKFKNNFVVGDIIKTDNIFGMRFIVIGIGFNKIITISLHAYEEGKIIYREFNDHDKSLSKCAFISDNMKDNVNEQLEYFESLGNQVIEAKRLRYVQR